MSAKTNGNPSGGKKTLTVVQTGSVIHCKPGMEETLKGLGLGKRHRRKTLEDTPAVRGMIRKVRHLVMVEGEQDKKGTRK